LPLKPSGCPAATFLLQADVPAGLLATFADPGLDLSPGTSASTTLTLTATGAPDGSYTILVTATNGTHVGSASAQAMLISDLAAAVWTDKPSYAGNQVVSVTALMTHGGAPLPNVSVRFTLTKANGSVVTGTATSRPDGTAGFSYRLKGKEPSGVYAVQADASVNELSATAATTFTVQ